MTGWFGESWGAPVCEPKRQVPVPLGHSCLWCAEEIVPGDRGLTMPHLGERRVTLEPVHFECHMRMVVGSAAHQLKKCACYGGIWEDPPELELRRELFFRHAQGAQHMLYADDGEMMCNTCMIDFKRLPVSELCEKLSRLNRERQQ